MKLYGALASPYVARVVLTARLKGLDLAPQMPPGGLKSPEYLAINPIGKMPALEDGGACLAESMVICEYLDEVYPQQQLAPREPLERARQRLLARILDFYLMQHLAVLFRNADPAKRDPAEVESATAGVRKALADLEHFMGPGPFALGTAPTLADCAMLPHFVVMHAVIAAFGVTEPLAGRARLARWWRHVEQHPVCGSFAGEYREAFLAFMKSRG